MRKLGELNVVGTIVRVYHATIKESGDELDAHTFGVFVAHAAVIYLQRWTDYVVEATALWGVLVHEALHAMWWETGAYLALKDACPRWTLEAREALEERIIVAISPPLATAICNANASTPPSHWSARAFLSIAIKNTDAIVALRDACPDLSDAALDRLVDRITDRLSVGLFSASPGLKQLRASIKKVAGYK